MKEQASDTRSIAQANKIDAREPEWGSTEEAMAERTGSSRSASTPESDRVDPSGLNLEGLHKSPVSLNSRAIIGNRSYAAGQTVSDTQLRRLTINDDHLVLQNGEGELVRLDLEAYQVSDSTGLSSLDPENIELEKQKQVYDALGKARNMGLL